MRFSKTFRRVTALCLTAVVALTVAACGSSGWSSTEVSQVTNNLITEWTKAVDAKLPTADRTAYNADAQKAASCTVNILKAQISYSDFINHKATKSAGQKLSNAVDKANCLTPMASFFKTHSVSTETTTTG
jgi:hypothetical protein